MEEVLALDDQNKEHPMTESSLSFSFFFNGISFLSGGKLAWGEGRGGGGGGEGQGGRGDEKSANME